jgi:GR25 family glycosyltransferase involved in LPS biosynthesis
MVDVYIVGLDANYRGHQLEEKLSSLGFSPVRVSAIDMRNIKVEDLDLDHESIKLWNGRYISSSEIGCQVSHRKAWELASKNNSTWSIILEDDALIDDSFVSFVDEIKSIKSKKPAIVSGYWPYAIVRRIRNHDVFQGKPKSLRKVVVPPYSTVCYAINSSAISSYLESDELRITTADWPLLMFTMNFYVYTKSFVKHPDDQSTIGFDREKEQKINSGSLKQYIASNDEKILSLLKRLKRIYRLLKSFKHPKPFTVVTKKLIYTLYYIQILHSIPGLKVLRGEQNPLAQRRIGAREIATTSKSIFLLAVNWFYWRSVKSINNRIYPVAQKVRGLGTFSLLHNFHQILARFKLRVARQKFQITRYVDYIDRDQELVEELRKITSATVGDISGNLQLTFCCILNVFNQKAIELERAYASILSQTKPFEQVIIYDDGSDNHETLIWLNALPERSIDFNVSFQIVRASNQGVVEARNLAFKLCQSNWVLFLDGDDELLSDYVHKVDRALQKHKTVEVVYPDYYISNDGESPQKGKSGPTRIGLMRRINTLPHSSFIKCSLFQEIGGYDSEFAKLGAEDWGLWVKANLFGARFLALNDIGYVYFKDQEESRSLLTDHLGEERRAAIEQMMSKFKSNL